MTDEKYNGWTNKQTWLVNAWIGDNELLSKLLSKQAIRCYQDAEEQQFISKRQDAIINLADELKDRIEMEQPIESNGLYKDLILNVLSFINWREITTHLIDEAINNTNE